MEAQDTPAAAPTLPKGKTRFLVEICRHGLLSKIREPIDFALAFPPDVLMGAIPDPQKRAEILHATAGTFIPVGIKKSPESSAQDLLYAMQCDQEAASKALLQVFQPHEWVTWLSPEKLWAYATDGHFWEPGEKEERLPLIRDHLRAILDAGLDNDLMSYRDIIDGIGIDALVEHLPRQEMAKIITGMLRNGRDGLPFQDEDVLTTVPTAVLVEHLPLDHIWNHVVVEKIAERHEFVEPPEILVLEEELPPAPVRPPPSTVEEKKQEALDKLKAQPFIPVERLAPLSTEALRGLVLMLVERKPIAKDKWRRSSMVGFLECLGTPREELNAMDLKQLKQAFIREIYPKDQALAEVILAESAVA